MGVDGADEIYALGLRNPWRESFDRALGDFYIADVGQGEWEEVNIGALGANYGWKRYEGNELRFPDVPASTPLTFPIHTYDHSVGESITGGYVYRGPGEGLQGHYFFGDFIAQKIFTLHFDGTNWVATDRTAQINEDVGTVNSISSFGEDAAGNLYVVDYGGEVFRLTPQVVSADQNDDLSGRAGDDMLFGGSGNDILRGGNGNDELQGGDGADKLLGGNGSDMLIGGAGNDSLNGQTGADAAAGGTGDDKHYVDDENDVVVEIAGEGTDTVYASADYALTAGSEVELMRANAGSQGLVLIGNEFANQIHGGAGGDTLNGMAGDDILRGNDGTDTADLAGTSCSAASEQTRLHLRPRRRRATARCATRSGISKAARTLSICRASAWPSISSAARGSAAAPASCGPSMPAPTPMSRAISTAIWLPTSKSLSSGTTP